MPPHQPSPLSRVLIFCTAERGLETVNGVIANLGYYPERALTAAEINALAQTAMASRTAGDCFAQYGALASTTPTTTMSTSPSTTVAFKVCSGLRPIAHYTFAPCMSYGCMSMGTPDVSHNDFDGDFSGDVQMTTMMVGGMVTVPAALFDGASQIGLNIPYPLNK